MRFTALLLSLICLSYIAFSALVDSGQVEVIQPQHIIVSTGDSIDAGFIGPGQTLSVMVSSKVDKGGKYGIGGNWDNLRAEDLPEGWTASFSEYGSNLKINIRAPPHAPQGKHRILLSVNDEYDREKIGEKVLFYLDVEVKDDVVDMYVFPHDMTVSTGSPARYTVRISNPSSASDVFVVHGQGILGWSFRKEVFVPAKSKTSFYYEIVNNDEEVIPLNITVVSKSSDRITESEQIKLTTKSSPYYDVFSIKNGLLIYPPQEFLIYGVLDFISSFL